LLKDLNSLSFYKKTHPKSLGLEWVKSVIFPLIDSYNLTVKDVLRTFVEHVSIQIGKELVSSDANALFTGGGVYNLFLMDRIKNYSNAKITIPNIGLIEFKEALIFAFLGVLRLRGEINVLASVTGAKSNHSSGKIFISSDR
jgi:anhydro-N-acetylmuramic acid kinase